MTEKRVGRPRKALPASLPPAFKRFTLELRRLADESVFTQRQLADRAGMSLPTVSRALNGERRLTTRDLEAFSKALGLSDTQRATLVFLHRQATDEAHGVRSDVREVAPTDLASRLSALRQGAGLSLREISLRLAMVGSPVAKSTVERVLDNPDRSPLLALKMAIVLLDALPIDERGPAAEGVFRAALDPVVPTSPGQFTVTAALGSGKTEAALALDSVRATPEATLASLARMLDLPVQELRALRESAAQARGRVPGRPISEWSPLELEVHPTASPIGPGDSTVAELPPYIQRWHDRLLAETVCDATEGQSQMVLVVGASSTGKTRACWEAIQPLAQHGWRLWHPFSPTRPEAVLEGIDRVEPRTVVWLNETQNYLLPAELGELVASALRRLLNKPERGPILILGTLWPDHLDRLTGPPAPGSPDLHRQARELLLAGRKVVIPDAFDPETLRLAEALAADDPRLADALTWSGSSAQVTQNLAGAPQLVSRYTTVTPAARAVLEAAMDACRLGISNPLPHSFLIDAAVDYLSDTAYEMLTDDWAEQAIAELTRPVVGGLSPLRPIRPRPATRPSAVPAPDMAPAKPAGPAYRLADYLDAYGRKARRLLCPPASFWHASYMHITAPEDLSGLAAAADDRYRLLWAHQLRRRAKEANDDQGLSHLIRWQGEAGDLQEAERLARASAGPGRTTALRELTRMRDEAGDRRAALFFARSAAEYGDALPLAELAWSREEEGEQNEAEWLAEQAAAIGDTYALRELARMREATGDHVSAQFLYRRAAECGDNPSLLRLAEARWESGDREEAERLALVGANVGDDIELIRSAQRREEAGDREEAEALYRQAVDTGSAFALAVLARMREEAGDQRGAEALCRQAADAGVAWLINPARRWPYGLDPDGAPTPPWK
ncbi:helix-turn-helix domain-containing protein [Streptomyces chartreusis]|uniref:helix-turn-helix domain-containing protein n=1 Tax=Streptomyces chartreusis TaxID=1969 RepID=UPI0033A9A5F5